MKCNCGCEEVKPEKGSGKMVCLDCETDIEDWPGYDEVIGMDNRSELIKALELYEEELEEDIMVDEILLEEHGEFTLIGTQQYAHQRVELEKVRDLLFFLKL